MSGSWIFLSHSGKDIHKIRKIRNEFEACGHNPLAFHLKCLSNETPKGNEEILQLLKREIDARDWFVFCESDASRKSEYVSFERDYILNSGKDKVWTLDLNEEMEVILSKVRQISKDLDIYLSYDPKDKHFGDTIRKLLERKDFTVWTDENSSQLDEDVFEKSAVYGVFIMLVTENSLERNFADIDYILNYCNGGETILPVFIGDNHLSAQDEGWLRSGLCLDIKENPEEKDFNCVIEYMEEYIQHSIKNL